MPSGRITKVVHLSLQSAGSADASPQPKGYGYLVSEDDGQQIYFEPKAVQAYTFDDLQAGQKIEFDPDPKLPVAKAVRIAGEVASPPAPQVELP
jgi:cold shock CspA family protein